MDTVYLEELEISPHKRRILQLRLAGHATKDIADMFGLSIKTIESHIQQIYDTYDVHNLLGLVTKFGWLRVSLKRSEVTENKPNLGLTNHATV